MALRYPQYGSVIIGDQGKLFFHRAKNSWILKGSPALDGFEWPEQSLPRANGQDNYQEWYDAVVGDIPQAESNFNLAGPMTETILLGVMAQRNPDAPLKWNSEKMEIQGRPELNSQIRRDYRDGWRLNV